MSDDEDSTARPRGVYWLPNLLTTGALFAGFYAVVAAIDLKFERAGAAVFIAMIFDGLDGRVARWTHTESAFGKDYTYAKYHDEWKTIMDAIAGTSRGEY